MVRDDTQRETSEVTAKSREHEGLGGKKILKLKINTPHFYRLKNLLMKKHHYQTTKQKSLLQ